jgi:GDP-L-fucose synthase
MENLEKRIYIAGHRGMVGSAIFRELTLRGYCNIITQNHVQLDLENQADVENFFRSNHIDEVYLAAARVGGIYANNTYPAEFIYQNLMIQCNVIHGAWAAGIHKILFLGSSCIYPKLAPQPIAEGDLLTGKLEATNEPYAVAKIAGIKLCESFNRQYGTDYRSVMPTNLYGPGDNYHPENSHVIPGMIRRFHEAKVSGASGVEVWGTGTPRREFLYVDDMARACIHIMELAEQEYREQVDVMRNHINVGAGKDIAISELAELVAETVGFQGEITYDRDKPDGTRQKLLDTTRLNALGWVPTVDLKTGLALTYCEFLKAT